MASSGKNSKITIVAWCFAVTHAQKSWTKLYKQFKISETLIKKNVESFIWVKLIVL